MITHLLTTILLLIPKSFQTHTHCGAHLTAARGHISTPGFPLPYPVPISCEWLIEAPRDHKVAVYFTQFYMKRGFTASDYTYYSTRIHSGVGRFDFGPISSVDEPTYLVSNQRMLVLHLNVRSLDNAHLRVREHLLDVAGFNVTYEVIPKNETVREDACIYHHCSFTGYCFASKDYAEYGCKCFEGYFGEECQYDEACGPTSASEVCQNGGTCRYYIGSSVRTCECLVGFTGAKCELSISSNKSSEISECRDTHSTPKDYVIIYPWNKKCYDHADLLIQRLEISEPLPVPEGVPLQIACIVTGNPRVTWLKDGFPIAFDASYGRIWHLTVPPDTGGRQAFLLGLDWTHELDSGVFTCQARDGPRLEKISVPITVQPEPELLMEPLAATILYGSSLNVTCFSKGFLSTRYSWRRQDRDPVRQRDPERVEDLYPVGSRLMLSAATRSANYTCESRSPTRVMRKTSIITVLNATEFSSSVCYPERSNGIRWKVTAIEATDIHICPSGYTGYISRKCLMGPHDKGTWEKPDFSFCFSSSILEIKKKFDSRKIGYRTESAQDLLDKLHDVLSQRRDTMHRSEGQQVVDMLFDTDSSFLSEASLEGNWKRFLMIASILFEGDLVHKQHELMKLILLVRNISLAFMRKINTVDINEQFESQSLRVNVIQTSNDSPLHLHIPWCQQNASICTSMDLKIDSLDIREVRNSSLVVSTIVYRCLKLKYLANSHPRDRSLEDYVPVFSVDIASAASEQVITKIQNTVTYPVTLNVSSNDKVDCLKFVLHEGKIERFNCVLIMEGTDGAHCRCNGIGLFSFNIYSYSGMGEYVNFHVNGKLWNIVFGSLTFILMCLLIFLKGILNALIYTYDDSSS